jgi:hypothetical protein
LLQPLSYFQNQPTVSQFFKLSARSTVSETGQNAQNAMERIVLFAHLLTARELLYYDFQRSLYAAVRRPVEGC